MEFKNLEQLEEIAQNLDKAELRPIQIAPSQVSPKETALYNATAYVAIWNLTKDQLETIVERKNSCVLQHKDAMGVFVRVAKKLGLNVSGNLKNHGGEVLVEALFDNMKAEDGSKEGITLGVRLENNYDKRGYPNFIVEPFGTRGVCVNGMMLGKFIGSVFQKHRKLADLDKALHEYIGKILATVKERLERQIVKAKEDVFKEEEDVNEVIMGELSSKKIAQRVKQLLEDKDVTRYTVYNAITQYATHDARDEKQRVRLQNIAQRVLVRPIDKLRTADWMDE